MTDKGALYTPNGVNYTEAASTTSWETVVPLSARSGVNHRVMRGLIPYDKWLGVVASKELAIFTPPSGTAIVVRDCWLDVATTFDGGTPTLDVGHSLDGDAFLDGVSLDVAGVVGDESSDKGDEFKDPQTPIVGTGKADSVTATMKVGTGDLDANTQGAVWVYLEIIEFDPA